MKQYLVFTWDETKIIAGVYLYALVKKATTCMLCTSIRDFKPLALTSKLNRKNFSYVVKSTKLYHIYYLCGSPMMFNLGSKD